jgi:hypothetical protein
VHFLWAFGTNFRLLLNLEKKQQLFFAGKLMWGRCYQQQSICNQQKTHVTLRKTYVTIILFSKKATLYLCFITDG